MYKIILLVFSIFSCSHAQVRSMGNVREVLKCAARLDYSCILDYAEDAAHNAYANAIKEADMEARKMSIETGRADPEEEQPSSILTTITNIISELPELLRVSLSAALNGEDADNDDKPSDGGNTKDAEEDDDEEEEEDDDDAEEENATEKSKTVGDEIAQCKNGTTCRGRTSKNVAGISSKQSGRSQHNGVARKKKKKEKKKKLKTIIKLIAVAIVLIVKLNIFLKLLAAKLQIKFFLIAVVNLLITLARFWWDLKKGHSDHPQKVIYYEHAQHQHHYDGGDDWHSSGPSESYWGRADADDKKTAQDLAYSKQAPGSITYSRVDDKPNFSWNPWAERSL
ncbi:hypothetical protein PPYR_01702 [Photinus pyralis]|uniref:Uncharacterized protein n=3 Tax=Photinus pyralis TaxID=7054 RepID=A0A5N4B562_PHOPY|nr:uncharacterized protein LOC116158966 [Photinus pyralis]KAB0804732.1 hypothetical protein PPYR_01702 [Photinus pyralis]